ncbi:hypothetical protein PVAP13_3KG436900 [Panicum virgatum]|uniref:Uncharacterized protein n=1 Tax=Panicum virgatum TaxID=38727 RepID=A0A8T0UY41_PANVG|nr:hypothetical protein PVAP13_3KG436900 [Panicum virgatum]
MAARHGGQIRRRRARIRSRQAWIWCPHAWIRWQVHRQAAPSRGPALSGSYARAWWLACAWATRPWGARSGGGRGGTGAGAGVAGWAAFRSPGVPAATSSACEGGGRRGLQRRPEAVWPRRGP